MVEYVYPTGLVLLGVPAAAAHNPSLYGAYVNSLAFRAQGAELESEFRLGSHLYARAGYTYLDARVQRSFSSDALGPSYNPSFPKIAIGNYGPLDGARPFRRAPHSGYFALQYAHSRFNSQLTGTLVGRRDDSTFLGGSDASYGNSLLLPTATSTEPTSASNFPPTTASPTTSPPTPTSRTCSTSATSRPSATRPSPSTCGAASNSPSEANPGA